MEPDEEWATSDNCGEEFPCTGPYNTFIKLEDTTYTGTTPDITDADL